MNFYLRCALVMTTLLIGACAHRGTLTPPPDMLEHQRQVRAIDQWQLTGKLGIRTMQDSGSASVKWVQESANYSIYLSGPLGQKRMVITGDEGRVRLEQSGEPAREATSAEDLIKQEAGWTIPVSRLAYWIRGIPAPTGKITRLEQDSAGLLAVLQQGDWVITYGNYQDQPLDGTTLPLPGRITAEYQDVRLVLAIRNWQLGKSPEPAQ